MVELLRNLPSDIEPEELCDYLCPIIAQTEKEQENFKAAYDKHKRYLLGKRSEEKLPLPRDTEEDKQGEKPPNRRRIRWLAFTLATLLATAGYFLYQYLNPITGCTDPNALNYNPKATKPCTDCCEMPPPQDVEPDVITGCMDSTAANYDKNATVQCDSCCVGCKNRSAKNYSATAHKACDDCCVYKQVAKKQYRDTALYIVPFSKKEVQPPTLQPLNDQLNYRLYQYKEPLSWLLWGLILAGLLSALLYRRARQRYVARQERNDEPPYSLPIEISYAQEILQTPNYYLMLNQLRGRQESTRQELDIPATIDATAQKGGQWDFQFYHHKKPVEYLVLIDKSREQNHQAQLAEYLFQQMEKNEVYATRYFFDANPAICWNEKFPEGVSLERLMQLHHDARLLLFSDGYGFINPVRSDLEPWVEKIGNWRERILLTSSPAGGWDHREIILSDFFTVMPATVEGLLRAVHFFEQVQAPTLADWKYAIAKNDNTIQTDADHIVQVVHDNYTPDQQRWIAACAIYSGVALGSYPGTWPRIEQ